MLQGRALGDFILSRNSIYTAEKEQPGLAASALLPA